MARIKKTRNCFRCGASFTWEKFIGSERIDRTDSRHKSASVRQTNLDGSIHYCSKGSKEIEKPQRLNAESFDVETNGSKASEFDKKIEALKAKIQRRKAESEKTENEGSCSKDSDEENEGSEDSPEGSGLEQDGDGGDTESDLADEPEGPQEAASDAGRAIFKLIEPFTETQIDGRVTKALESFKGNAGIIEHVIKVETSTSSKVVLGAHVQTAYLVKLLSIGLNVLLVGPAGSGKTTAGLHAAQALDLKFYPISLGPQTSKTDLLGYTDAHGRPVWTVVRQAYVHGGLLLLDEIDASNAGVLTCLNALLANGHATFPASVDDLEHVTVEQKHANFRVIASGNTFGQGANRMYVGRQQLDAATLDRFVGIEWLYDTDFETKVCASQPEWLAYVWELRAAQELLEIRCVFGSRSIIDGCKMLDAGISRVEVEKARLWFGVSADDKAKLLTQLEGRR